MSKPALHHYVPQHYQKGFTDGEELLWVYDRRSAKYLHLHPKRICCERHFYTIFDGVRQEGGRNQGIESEFLQTVDGDGAKAIRELRESGGLSSKGEEVLAFYMAIQYLRVPVMRRFIAELYCATAQQITRLALRTPERAQASWAHAKLGKLSREEAESLAEGVKAGAFLIKATERPFLHHMLQMAETVAHRMRTCSWAVLTSPKGTGFIFSDRPLVLVPPRTICPDDAQRSIGVGIPGTAKFFPLCRQLCLHMGAPGTDRIWSKVDRELVRVINLNVAANSDRFIMSPERVQLESLVRRSGSEFLEEAEPFAVEQAELRPDDVLMRISWKPRRYFYPRE